jgi:hypothetical protein
MDYVALSRLRAGQADHGQRDEAAGAITKGPPVGLNGLSAGLWRQEGSSPDQNGDQA